MPTITQSEYIDSLYFPTSMWRTENEFKSDLKRGRFKEVDASYERQMRIPVVLICSKGNVPRASVSAIQSLYADFGHIGDKWAMVYLYNEDRSIAYPRKFNVKKHRILIDTYR